MINKIKNFFNKATNQKAKQTKKDVLMEIVLVNNSTDKEYIYKSENDFGLTLDIDRNWIEICKLNSFEDEGTSIAFVTGFSMVKCEYKTVNCI